MELFSQKNTAIWLGIGSLLFLIAAFNPSSRVFGEAMSDTRIEIINSLRTLWNISQVLFGLGALITVLALGMMVYELKYISGSQWAQLAVILMLVGSLLWCWHLGERIIYPEGFAHGSNTPYLFMIYSLLSQAGLILIGFFMLKTGIANWVGWMIVISAGIFFILMVIFQDMPPFVYYVISGIASVSLYQGTAWS